MGGLARSWAEEMLEELRMAGNLERRLGKAGWNRAGMLFQAAREGKAHKML